MMVGIRPTLFVAVKIWNGRDQLKLRSEYIHHHKAPFCNNGIHLAMSQAASRLYLS